MGDLEEYIGETSGELLVSTTSNQLVYCFKTVLLKLSLVASC